MADTAISALTSASALDGTEVFPLVQSATTKKTPISAIATYLGFVTSVLPVAKGGTGVSMSGTTAQIVVGGGTNSAIVWTNATGTDAPVRATDPQFTASIGIGMAPAAGYAINTASRVFFAGRLDAVLAGEGIIAAFGANGVAALLSISYVSNETIFAGSQYGNTVIATASNQNVVLRPNGTGIVQTTCALALSVAGNGIQIKEGSNATLGVATLSGGTVTVSTTNVTATSRIFLEVQALGTVTVPTMIGITARTAGTSFVISSANVVDTSTIAWVILEPAS